METFLVHIITPNYVSDIEGVSSLNIRTINGEITILPQHYPLISAIDISKVKFVKDKLPILAFASDGMINVKEKEVILILNAFEFKDDIDLARAKASYQRAFERINSKADGIDIKRAEAALNRAITRISLVEK